MRKRKEQIEKLQNFRFGLQPSIYVNSKRKKGAKAVTPLEFFGQAENRPVVKSADEIRRKLNQIAAIRSNAQSR